MDKYKTFSQRFWAGIIDESILILLSFFEFHYTGSEDFIFISIYLLYVIAYSSYYIFCHALYGQTLGKKMMNIKVLDVSEKRILSIKQAIMRESVPILLYILTAIYFLFLRENQSYSAKTDFIEYSSLYSILWLITELISMFFNSKGRAIHDYLANSVVVRI